MNPDELPPPPKHWGWRFQYGLDRIALAYKQARKEAVNEFARLKRESEKLSAIEEAGPLDEDEERWRDSISQNEGFLADEWYQAEEIDRLIVEAFTMTLFHFWEKQVKSAMRKAVYEHNASFAWLKKHGFKPSARLLTELKYAAETVKHSSGSSAVELYKMNRAYFDPHWVKNASEADHYGLRITDEQFQRFFEAVRASGPQDRRPGFS